jgi:hypothetical protein
VCISDPIETLKPSTADREKVLGWVTGQENGVQTYVAYPESSVIPAMYIENTNFI